jgi:hypothetical protein
VLLGCEVISVVVTLLDNCAVAGAATKAEATSASTLAVERLKTDFMIVPPVEKNGALGARTNKRIDVPGG